MQFDGTIDEKDFEFLNEIYSQSDLYVPMASSEQRRSDVCVQYCPNKVTRLNRK